MQGSVAPLFPGQEQRQRQQQYAKPCTDSMRQIPLADVDQRRRHRGDGGAAGNPQQNAAKGQHAAQPDNEGRNAQVGGHIAVGQADHQPAQRDHAQVCQQRHVVNDIQNCRQATEQAEHRAHGQVDLATDDDQHHATRQNAGDGHLSQQVGEVARGQKSALGLPAEKQPDNGNGNHQREHFVAGEELFDLIHLRGLPVVVVMIIVVRGITVRVAGMAECGRKHLLLREFMVDEIAA